MVARVSFLIVFLLYIGSSFCLFSEPALGQTATVVGKVTDSETGKSLIGANVQVAGTSLGSATDIEGNFEISNLHAGIHILRASFIGYSAQELTVTLVEGENYVWNIALDPGTDLDPVQVTAGRRNEKTLNAPSSIDVITSRDLQLDVAQTTAKSLRNVTGLDMVQTGVDRYEIVLRGFNDAFSRSTHVLTDYRKAAVASIGVNLHNVMPSLAIDTERIEVVRGPGSALYGPGVDSGVIHYISKDAFNYPGATISIAGGQRSMLNVQGRVATVLGTNLGVKVIGSYATSEDFTLEGCDAALLKSERFSECPDPEDAVQLFVDGVRETKNRKLVLSSTVDLRLGQSTTISLSGGIGNLDGAMLSSLGTIQAKGMAASYAQIRLSSGPLFVQAYMNSINSGNSYIYGGDPVQEYSEEFSVQGQYTQEIGAELLDMGADPNRASDAGATPLYAVLNVHWAPKARHPQPLEHEQQQTGYLELMRALLEAGADVNARLERTLWFTTYNRDLLGVDRTGATPFWRATHATDVPAMKLLLEYGADPHLPTIKVPQRSFGPRNDTDHSGLPPVPIGGPAVPPIHAAAGVGYGQGFAGNSHRHAPDGWMPTMRFLVEELGADVNARDLNGYTPVHHAAARGDNEMILYLVERGADVTAVARNGRTTVDMANGPVQRIQPFVETVALLERLGAKNNHRCVSC